MLQLVSATLLAVAQLAALAAGFDLGGWELSTCDERLAHIPATVPGMVNTDLMAAGLISSDPYFRYHELNQSWVAQECWQYAAAVDLSAVDVGSGVPVLVHFENVDTAAEIYFNDALVAYVENSFRPHSVEIPADLLTPGEGNTLRVKILPALSVALEKSEAYPYAVPETENYNVWAEPSHRNFVRKTGNDMGWDWGPAYVPAGLWGQVHVSQCAAGRMESVLVQSRVDVEGRRAELDVWASVRDLLPPPAASAAPAAYAFEVQLQGEVQLRVTLTAEDATPPDVNWDVRAGGESQQAESCHASPTEPLSPQRRQHCLRSKGKGAPSSASTAPTATSSSTENVRLFRLGTFSIEGDDFHLWWPRGYGEAHLYDLQVLRRTVGGAAGGSSGCPDSDAVSRSIGLRTVELVQEPMPAPHAAEGEERDAAAPSSTRTSSRSGRSTTKSARTVETPASPASFYFRVNGVPVYALGANFIPIDAFESRVTQADREFVLRAAVASNMNMVRVWGGGRYQPDGFYELADRLGVMVWQEVMLACALYPRNEEMLAEVALEVGHQTRRLQSHPSIVIWGGNNENEVALGWFPEVYDNRDLYVSDYSALYGGTVYKAIVAADGDSQRPWVDSSPSNGLISTAPYAKLWGAASTELAGDVHFYDYSMDCEDYSLYPKARFVSEFGFQSTPSFLGYEPVTSAAEGDWDPDSPLLLYRQRHEDGNAQMRAQVERHFLLPANANATDVEGQRAYFDNYLYLMQVQQARCYETAFARWRQLQSTATVHTMGILYWQLNDIWQGPSWASMEWGGRWKPLQYTTRRVFAPLALSFSGVAASSGVGADGEGSTAGSKTVELWVANNHPHGKQLDVVVRAKAWAATDGDSDKDIVARLSAVTVAALRSELLLTVDVARDVLQQPALDCPSRAHCYLQASGVTTEGEVVFDVTFPLTVLKDAALSPATAVVVGDVVPGREEGEGTSFSFAVSNAGDAACPFLFFELANTPTEGAAGTGSGGVYDNANAGWFSDNHFLLPAHSASRTLTYTATAAASRGMTAADFAGRLRYRCLQQLYDL